MAPGGSEYFRLLVFQGQEAWKRLAGTGLSSLQHRTEPGIPEDTLSQQGHDVPCSWNKEPGHIEEALD